MPVAKMKKVHLLVFHPPPASPLLPRKARRGATSKKRENEGMKKSCLGSSAVGLLRATTSRTAKIAINEKRKPKQFASSANLHI